MTDEESSMKQTSYRLNPYFELIIENRDQAVLVASLVEGPQYELRDEDGDEALASLLKTLRGGATVEEMIKASGQDLDKVADVIESFERNDIVHSYQSTPTMETESKSYLDLARFRKGATEPNSQLSSLQVIADEDIEELFDRQWPWETINVNYRTGPRQPEVGDSWIPESDTSTAVVCITHNPLDDDWRKLFQGLWENGVPHFIGSIFGLDTFVGPAVLPPETPCFDCFLRGLSANYPTDKALTDVNSFADECYLSEVFTGICISNLIIHVTHYCFNLHTLLAGRVEYANLLSLEREASKVYRNPYCETCGRSKDGTIHNPAFSFGQQGGE